MKKTLFTKFSVERAPDFQITTSILERDGQKIVEKKAYSQQANPHIEKIKENCIKLQNLYKKSSTFQILSPISQDFEHSLYSLSFPFIEEASLDQWLVRELQEQGFEAYFSSIKNFYEQLISFENPTFFVETDNFKKIFGSSKNAFEGELTAPISNIDIIFSNIFLKSSGSFIYTCIDPEWVFDFPVPIMFSLYRALSTSVTFFKLTAEQKNTVFAYFKIDSERLSVLSNMDIQFQKFAQRGTSTYQEIYEKLDTLSLNINQISIESHFIKPYAISENGVCNKSNLISENSISFPITGNNIQFSLLGKGKSAVFKLDSITVLQSNGQLIPIENFHWNGDYNQDDFYYSIVDSEFSFYVENGIELIISYQILQWGKEITETLLQNVFIQNELTQEIQTKTRELLALGDEKNKEILALGDEKNKEILALGDEKNKEILALGDKLYNLEFKNASLNLEIEELRAFKNTLIEVANQNSFSQLKFLKYIKKENS